MKNTAKTAGLGATESTDYSAIERERHTKTPEGTPVKETYYADGYVKETFSTRTRRTRRRDSRRENA